LDEITPGQVDSLFKNTAIFERFEQKTLDNHKNNDTITQRYNYTMIQY